MFRKCLISEKHQAVKVLLYLETGEDTEQVGESLPVQKEEALRKRSAMLSHHLVMCLSRLGRLSAQY